MNPKYILGNNCIIEENVFIGKKLIPEIKCSKTKIGNNALIRSGTIIYCGNKIGDNFRTGHNVLIRHNNMIRDNVSIGSGTEIAFETLIEDNVRIHSGAFIPEFTILRKGCWVGPRTVITNSRYPLSKDSKYKLQPVEIMENVKIGANATILPGIKIRKNSIIGAGSVVTKDVPENSVYVGSPAKFLRYVTEIKNEKGECMYG